MKRLILFVTVFFAAASLASVSAQNSEYEATELYQVDLETGELMMIGEVGEGHVLTGFALDTNPENDGIAVGLTDTGELVWFDVSSPDTIVNSVEITGVEDDMLVGIDYRPATHDLYAISENGFIYWIDTESGEAMMAGEDPFDPALESNLLGFDFNPTVDLIRMDADSTQNLRIDPESGMVGVTDDGEPMIDGNTMYAEGDEHEGADARVVAAGYTNNMDGAEETTLYVFDAGNNTFATQDPPNDGVLNTVAVVEPMISDWTAFDIGTDDAAYVTIPRMAGDGMEDVATPEDGN